jgi:hypothetical protein
MPRIRHIRGDEPNDNTMDLSMPGYNFKRGKITPDPKPSWGARDGMNKPLDTENGKKLLDEALGE